MPSNTLLPVRRPVVNIRLGSALALRVQIEHEKGAKKLPLRPTHSENPNWNPYADCRLGGGSWPLGGSWVLGGSWPLGTESHEAGLGYHADLPDFRDIAFDKDDKRIQRLVTSYSRDNKSFVLGTAKGAQKRRSRVHLADLHPLPPVENQGSIGSCTSNAAIGVIEYLISRSSGVQLEMSRMFLYKNTRRLLGWQGDTGAYMRTAFQAMRMFGVPLEKDWPYEASLLDVEPDAYLFSMASNFKTMVYARLDDYNCKALHVLQKIRDTVADGFPIAFGFTVYESISSMGEDFVIPFPKRDDRRAGGHAVVVVGYDDSIKCGTSDDGALIIRNSWGGDWGDAGYAYLPYSYVLSQLAVDFWTAYDEKWLDLESFR